MIHNFKIIALRIMVIGRRYETVGSQKVVDFPIKEKAGNFKSTKICRDTETSLGWLYGPNSLLYRHKLVSRHFVRPSLS